MFLYRAREGNAGVRVGDTNYGLMEFERNPPYAYSAGTGTVSPLNALVRVAREAPAWEAASPTVTANTT